MLMIKPGVLPQPKRFLFKCTNCGCEWIADESELIRYYSENKIHYFGDAVCPTCDNIVACLREVSPEEYDKMCDQVEETRYQLMSELDITMKKKDTNKEENNEKL